MTTSLPLGYQKQLMMFAGRANPALAASIAATLQVDLGPITLKTFSNGGEVYCRFDESVRGADVFLIQPMSANPDEGSTPTTRCWNCW